MWGDYLATDTVSAAVLPSLSHPTSPQSHEETQKSGCPFHRLGNQPSGRFLQGHRPGSDPDQKCKVLCLACPSLREGHDLGSHVKLINVGCWQGPVMRKAPREPAGHENGMEKLLGSRSPWL